MPERDLPTLHEPASPLQGTPIAARALARRSTDCMTTTHPEDR